MLSNLKIRRILLLNILIGFSLVCTAYTSEKKGKSWTLKTDDTKLTISIGADNNLYINELSNPNAGWNWIKSPSLFPLISRIDIAGKEYQPKWEYKYGILDKTDGTKVIIHFINENPSLELSICWHARSGPGPIRHTMTVRNNSGHMVTIYNQESLDVQITAPESRPNLWYFNDMGWSKVGYGGPSGEGMFHDKLDSGYSKVINFSDQSGYMPYVVVDTEGGKWYFILAVSGFFGRISIDAENTPKSAHLKAGNGENF